MKNYAIIVAGGSGKRMGSSIPKQFLEVNGLPLIMHTLYLFYRFDAKIQVIVVLPSSFITIWKELCTTHSFGFEHTVAEGGPTRYHSVKSGLKYVSNDNSLVAVHDAVRPLVSPEVIISVFRDADYYGNAVPVMPVRDSIRERIGADNRPLDRSKLFLVQTPQCFRTSILKKAYLQNYREEFTDDASLVEVDGGKIHLVEGNSENIKITKPSDLMIAEVMLKAGEKRL
jgi:2-C-methyl-D-erythritol 4-phosphate cytidylyltransferase